MEKSLTILALDTSLGGCSVAVWRDGNIIAQDSASETGKQSRLLVSMLETTLAKANLSYADCNALACTVGPGGFTAIRVGLATARAITLVTHQPLIGITSLEVIAWQAKQQGDVLAVVNAYRGQWYAQRFRQADELTPISEPLLVDDKGLQALAHGAKIIEGEIHASAVAQLAAHKWSQGIRHFPTAPLYIREPDAKLPLTPAL